jgi:hypothetical protein
LLLKFILSKNPRLIVEFRVFNFYQFNDVSQTAYYGPLLPDEMTGNRTIRFSVNPVALRAAKAKMVDYMTGGRVYIEVTVGSLVYGSGLDGMPVFPTFLDFFDLPKSAGNAISGSTISVWVYVGAGIGGALLMYETLVVFDNPLFYCFVLAPL